MSWKKGELVAHGFEEAGFSKFAYNLTPEQLQSGLETLDALMAEWNMADIRLGYPLPSQPGNSGLQELSRIPDGVNSAVYNCLALRLCSRFGKEATAEVKRAASVGYRVVCSVASAPQTQQMPSMFPAGAGNRWRRSPSSPFLDPPTSPVTNPEQSIDFE